MSTPLHEWVALAREKGYAIDIAVYGGEHLDAYEHGVRITAYADPMDVIARGLNRMRELPANPDRKAARVERDADNG